MAAAERFKSMTPMRQALAIGIVVFCIAALLMLIWFNWLRTPYQIAFSGLKSEDAATIIAELDKRKTPYQLADGGTAILVPQADVDATRINILGGDLPLKGAVGFELFNKSDMGLTEFAQKINYQRALQGELARTIMSFEAVDTARVHLSMPEDGIFERDKRVAKASVTLSLQPGKPADKELVESIQNLVASAVPDILADNIAILDTNGSVLSRPADVAPAAPPSTQQREGVEQFYAGKVSAALAELAVDEGARVSVDAIFPDDAAIDLSSAFVTENRSFPLKITIMLKIAGASGLKSRVEEMAKKAVGYDAQRGDEVTVLFGALNAIPSTPLSVPHAHASNPKPVVQQSERNFLAQWNAWWTTILIGIVCVAAVVFVGLWRRRISTGARQSFADRLKAALDEGGFDEVR